MLSEFIGNASIPYARRLASDPLQDVERREVSKLLSWDHSRSWHTGMYLKDFRFFFEDSAQKERAREEIRAQIV